MPSPRNRRVPIDFGSVAVPRGRVYVIPPRCKKCLFCVNLCPKDVLNPLRY